MRASHAGPSFAATVSYIENNLFIAATRAASKSICVRVATGNALNCFAVLVLCSSHRFIRVAIAVSYIFTYALTPFSGCRVRCALLASLLKICPRWR